MAFHIYVFFNRVVLELYLQSSKTCVVYWSSQTYTSRKQIYYWSLPLLFPCIRFNKAIWWTHFTKRNWNHILSRFYTDNEGGKDNKRHPKTETCLVENVPKRKRRNRSHFTQRQLQYLEKIFSRQQYLTRDERTLLARGLEMTELQIRNWFQNQRYQKKHRSNENKKQEKLEFSVSGEKSQPWNYHSRINRPFKMADCPRTISMESSRLPFAKKPRLNLWNTNNCTNGGERY